MCRMMNTNSQHAILFVGGKMCTFASMYVRLRTYNNKKRICKTQTTHVKHLLNHRPSNVMSIPDFIKDTFFVFKIQYTILKYIFNK